MTVNKGKISIKERDQEKLDNERLQIRIGQNVSRLRKDKGYSQTELAIKMNNRDRQVVQRLENGKTNCSLNLIRVTAEALDVDIKTLFD